MIRTILFLIIILHGLVHLIGFLKEFGYGFTSELNGEKLITMTNNAIKGSGTFWMITCVVFVYAGVLYLLKKDWYWIPAFVALVTSQTLIIIYWKEANLGTIVNVIILIAVILSAAKFEFNRQFKTVAHALKNEVVNQNIFVSEDKVKELPQSVQRWLQQSSIIGKTHSNIIHVFQKGNMRLKPTAAWIPFQSEEYFTVNPPSFVWRADIEASAFITIGGRDKYQGGTGNMVIKPLYLFTMVNSKGNEINQGTLLRYLGEMAWFPQAAISDYLYWKEIDSLHAHVTMKYKGVTASGVFTFNDEGLVSGFEAQRYGDFHGEYRMETWSVATKSFKCFDGKKIGNLSEVSWKLKEGDFLWMTMEVTDIQ
jgi:hypothetical protein